jgi:hypothetical protein
VPIIGRYVYQTGGLGYNQSATWHYLALARSSPSDQSLAQSTTDGQRLVPATRSSSSVRVRTSLTATPRPKIARSLSSIDPLRANYEIGECMYLQITFLPTVSDAAAGAL